MNGTPQRIEIFAPFGAAFEWMQKVLFRPFDLSKWLVIAFAAFLSGGWHSGFGFNPFFQPKDWQSHAFAAAHENATEQLPVWAVPLVIGGCAVGLVFLFVIIWILSRGRFIFTDCVVRNRAAIAEPWREYRREGNSYFLFSLGLTIVALLSAGLVFGIVAIPLGLFSAHRDLGGVAIALLFVVAALLWLVIGGFLAVVTHLMVPIMYRRRCPAMEAFSDASRLVLSHFASFVLLVLFAVVLFVALGMLGTIVNCATCCIGALPYVNTVLLLPAYVTLRAFLLFYLRQFGPDYDVWATLPQPVSSEPPVQPPPATPPEPPPLPA